MRTRSLKVTLAVPVAVCAALAAKPTLGQELTWELDPARTTVQFTLHDVLHTVQGHFQLKRGDLRFNPLTGKMGGEVVVDAASGASGSHARDRRMHKNILESARYPEIVFTPDRVAGMVALEGASQVTVHGMFRIHGTAHEMTLPFKVQIRGGRLTATTHFSIPYVRWGMKNPSTFLLRVSDKVDIDITACTR
jgi:polyisoprenoid-binding protein YceI